MKKNNSSNIYINKFNKFINNSSENKEFIELSELYTEVKKHYDNKLKDKDSIKREEFIKIEKIRLENNIGRHYGVTFLALGYASTAKRKEASMLNICIKVLDDIEKEMTSGISNLCDKEIAATFEELPKEQVKHISNQSNGNWSITISETNLFEMAKGTYKAVKFIGKLFKKKK
jgi:hypothetical protein